MGVYGEGIHFLKVILRENVKSRYVILGFHCMEVHYIRVLL
jgi:hypothetical protein